MMRRGAFADLTLSEISANLPEFIFLAKYKMVLMHATRCPDRGSFVHACYMPAARCALVHIQSIYNMALHERTPKLNILQKVVEIRRLMFALDSRDTPQASLALSGALAALSNTSLIPQRCCGAGGLGFTGFYIFTRLVLYIYAPEGCPHGTHTSGTAYTRGTYSRAHTQTQTNT